MVQINDKKIESELEANAGKIEVLGMLTAVRIHELISQTAITHKLSTDEKQLLLTVAVTETVTSMLNVQQEYSEALAANIGNGLIRIIQAIVAEDPELADILSDELTQEVIDEQL